MRQKVPGTEELNCLYVCSVRDYNPVLFRQRTELDKIVNRREQ